MRIDYLNLHCVYVFALIPLPAGELEKQFPKEFCFSIVAAFFPLVQIQSDSKDNT